VVEVEGMASLRLPLLASLLVLGCALPETPETRARRAREAQAELLAAASQPLPTGCADRLEGPEGAPAGEEPPIQPIPGGKKGTLSKQAIRDVVRSRRPEMEACYWEERRRNPRIEGRVDVRFVIADTGQVCAVEVRKSTVGAPQLERCMLGQFARMRFPPPKGGGVVLVTYPYIFKP
jgi:TonB family protein